MTFPSLGLSAELLRAVAEQGYEQPTPIQQQAIPAVLAGRDVLAGAQTGTGKTASFTLPLLQRLAANQAGGAPSRNAPQNTSKTPIRALILTPTRELAAQVHANVTAYGRHLPLKSAVIFGGVSINAQIATLRRRVDILVATPGRLLDLVSQKAVDLSQIEILVLDEADRMLDMGFIRDIRKVLALLPPNRQNLLFSATFSADIRKLAQGLLRNPAQISVAAQNSTADRIEQIAYSVEKTRKRALLSYLVGSQNWRQVLVFTRTKHGANRLAQQLEQDGLTAAAIHGNKSQGARTRALDDFKNGRVRVLVATDIAARGLDIDQLPYVINYDLPHVPEDYVHRIGRTGRAGREGLAISLIGEDDRPLMASVERLLGFTVRRESLPDFPAAPAAPSEANVDARRAAGQPQRKSANGQAEKSSSRTQPSGNRGPQKPQEKPASARRRSRRSRNNGKPGTSGNGPRPTADNRPTR